ncbi:MAG: DUF1232 domain-containing protein [Nitrospirae bacterium]|nr:DUF1232 domain-containing protein [Nitrospirota bacterium]
MAYIASQIGLIPDGVMFFGQIDGLIVVGFSYALRKTTVDPVVLEECREQHGRFYPSGGANRMKFSAAFSAIWVFLLTALVVYLLKKTRITAPSSSTPCFSDQLPLTGPRSSTFRASRQRSTSAPCCPASPERFRPCTSGRTQQHSLARQG